MNGTGREGKETCYEIVSSIFNTTLIVLQISDNAKIDRSGCRKVRIGGSIYADQDAALDWLAKAYDEELRKSTHPPGKISYLREIGLPKLIEMERKALKEKGGACDG